MMNLMKKSMSLALAGIMAVSTLAGTSALAFAKEEAKLTGATLNLTQAVSIAENDKDYSYYATTQNYTVEKEYAQYQGQFGQYYDAATDTYRDYTVRDNLKSQGINDVYRRYSIGNIFYDNKSTVTFTYSDGSTNTELIGDCYDNYSIYDAAGRKLASKIAYSSERYNQDNDDTKVEFRAQTKSVFNGVTYDNTLKAGSTYNVQLGFGSGHYNNATEEWVYDVFVNVPLTINHAGTAVVNKKAATYWAKGFTGNTVCTDCGAIISAGKATAKKAVSISSVKSPSKKAIKATYKKVSKATGYQVSYSTSSKFTKKTTKTATVKGYKNTSKTIKNLKAGKKYYVKVRGYKTVKGKKTYSSWSKVKTVTVKK